jgi:hypothetical protein
MKKLFLFLFLYACSSTPTHKEYLQAYEVWLSRCDEKGFFHLQDGYEKMIDAARAGLWEKHTYEEIKALEAKKPKDAEECLIYADLSYEWKKELALSSKVDYEMSLYKMDGKKKLKDIAKDCANTREFIKNQSIDFSLIKVRECQKQFKNKKICDNHPTLVCKIFNKHSRRR